MLADKDNVKELARRNQEEIKSFFTRLKRKKPKDLDDIIHRIHEQVCEEFNCLECANCCSSISPMILDKDIERMARFLKIKPLQFIEKYLQADEEDHCFVYKENPCPFLLPDKYCLIYEVRPKACAEYPHTDRRRIHQILDLTLKNREICPIVYEVIERLKNEFRI
jgi:Fe-S-cluster containining protein